MSVYLSNTHNSIFCIYIYIWEHKYNAWGWDTIKHFWSTRNSVIVYKKIIGVVSKSGGLKANEYLLKKNFVLFLDLQVFDWIVIYISALYLLKAWISRLKIFDVLNIRLTMY